MIERVALVGNCQVWGLAASLRLQCPEIGFDDFFVGDIKTAAQGDELAARLGDYQLVLTHPQENEALGDLRSSRLEQIVRSLVRLPKVWFTGFHPDLLIIPDRRLAVPRFGRHHSLLIGAAFLAGIDQGEAEDLFNAYLFARLGFFDEYAKARAYMAMSLERAGLDAGAVLAEWERQGVFMHMPNHPSVETLWVLARAIAEQLGLGPRETDERPADSLEELREWPVYPPLARRLGAPGGLTFRTHKDAPPVSLGEFIDVSYARYRARREEVSVHPELSRAAEILRTATASVARA